MHGGENSPSALAIMGILADARRTDAPRLRLAVGKVLFAIKGVGSFGGIGAHRSGDEPRQPAEDGP
jgi:hypothetical protein